ncbi:putative F-box protein At4g09190 isoform X2 [Prosopis cineraria]|uniref:putative F-box protein At4g09190 isoform X2 n=1 Tax=Prosopis cineraria TaxID=364024 RepID=UPI0024105703|nr:putative F-box protein At4g09190 isoform X2 [Prosopis cineraria]
MKDDDKAILPQDIIIEILKRLPVKSLIRFQSVCKLWKNLIQTPAFITNHLHHSAHNNPSLILINSWYPPNCPHVFLLDSKMEIVEVHKTPLSNSSRGDVKLVGSCNGLLCLELDYHDDASFRFILLWNPASREIFTLSRHLPWKCM